LGPIRSTAARESLPMNVLVAYASRHGATREIAERIAQVLRTAGLAAEARPATEVRDLAPYDAVVIGSAAYMFHWLKEASSFVHRHRAVLAAKPVWLFSSGPLGTEPVNEEGVDQKVAAIPKELPELQAAVGARDHLGGTAPRRVAEAAGAARARLAARAAG
jgi:menaquinone-dependent protoporphyrinogen oxidase